MLIQITGRQRLREMIMVESVTRGGWSLIKAREIEQF